MCVLVLLSLNFPFLMELLLVIIYTLFQLIICLSYLFFRRCVQVIDLLLQERLCLVNFIEWLLYQKLLQLYEALERCRIEVAGHGVSY